MLCAYLLPGTLGHDPWKQDETYTFGIIQHMLESGDFVVPSNAGQPFVEKPPLYDWIATGLAWLFERCMPLHDAARLASALFTALTLGCVARLARGATRARGWLDIRVLGALALFAGTLVVLKHSHDLITDVALMAGTALGFCGLIELTVAFVRRPQGPARQAVRTASIMLGAGVGMTFMTKGLFLPLVFGATFCAIPLLYPACRSRAFLRSLGLAALVFAPFALIWPIAFYLRSEALFEVWFWDNNVGRFFGFSVSALGSENNKPLFIWRALVTVGFPVAPLAAAALASGAWRRWREPQIALPVVFCGVGLVVLQVSATCRELYVLPFIAPLTLVALQGVERLPQRVHLAWDYASRALFGAIAAVAWVVWSDMTDPASTHANLQWLGRWLPLDWTLPIRPHLVLAALTLTIGWVWLMPLFARAGKWRGAFSWCTGAVVTWGLVFTLLVPWIDEAKSYRSAFEDLDTHLNTAWIPGDCMASLNLGESEAPMLYYFTGVLHRPAATPDASACRWLIVQSVRTDAAAPDSNWEPFWSGARPGDDSELLRVFVRKPGQALAVR
nr:glycosyl transferase [Trinickia terrae]